MTSDLNEQSAEQVGINTIRALALDATHKAQSGHQGTALALAPLAHVLFTRVLRYDAANPLWPDRDRFVLSGGHASMLQYALLYLTGFGLELEDLKEFRQWGSATPGHPEVGHTAGIEVTTGPLGQGFANAVGMAVAERNLRARFGDDLCDHYTYVLAGDGDLAEGVSHEAASLAGHLGLGRLIAVYDDNHVSIDGPTELSLSDDAPSRFRAYGWHVIELSNAASADDLDALTAALAEAKAVTDRPSIIVLRTEIGFPSPGLTGHFSAHGNPFDDAEIAATKTVMGMDPDASFSVVDEVLSLYREAGRRGASEREAWEKRLADSDHAEAWAQSWQQPNDVRLDLEFEVGASLATRKASQSCVTALDKILPNLVGGSADLTGNTGTKLDSEAQSKENPAGRQIYFGVREHAMGSILVGVASHGGLVPFGGTFLVFADYMRPAVRLAAMSKAKCVFVWTHDSVGVGEDGPTHQPVEQLMSLRAIPGLTVLRPGDANEVAGAWQTALSCEGPAALILSRQGMPVLESTDRAKVDQGAYRIVEAEDAQLSIIGTGSELSLCVQAAEQLRAEGIGAHVVSMPSWDRFEQRSSEQQAAVIDRSLPAISLEAGTTLGWHRYATHPVGIDRFGASAPGQTVLDELGISVDAVVAAAHDALGK